MSRPIVVFTDDTVHPAAADKLAETCELRILKGSYPPEGLLAETCVDADAILARMGVVTRKVIEAAPRLKIIARHGIGVDAVDLDAATENGILVTTTGSANSRAVAEYTFALLLSLARKTKEADASMRGGEWSREPLMGLELAGKTLGIVGHGTIGSIVAKIGAGFGMNVLAQDPNPRRPAEVEMTTREDLLARSDIVTLHMRYNKDTWHTIDAKNLEQMKPTAVLVNTARGELVDEKALIAALQEKRIAGAALDVFESEPLSAASPLRALPNVFLSPHVAGQTQEAMQRVAIAAAEAILETLAGRTPRHIYNRLGLAERLKRAS